MNKNKKQAIQSRTTEPLFVGVDEIMSMFSVSRSFAQEIGKRANATSKIGRRRFYNVEKITAYFESMSDNSEIAG